MKNAVKIFLFFLIIFIMNGCGGAGEQSEGTQEPTVGAAVTTSPVPEPTKTVEIYVETAKQAVNNAMKALKKEDKEVADKYFDYDAVVLQKGGKKNSDESLYSPFKTFKYRLLSSAQDGSTYYFDVRISNKDLNAIINKMIDEVNTEVAKPSNKGLNSKGRQTLAKKILGKIVKSCKKTITTTVTVKVWKYGNEWKVDITKPVLNAIYGREPVEG